MPLGLCQPSIGLLACEGRARKTTALSLLIQPLRQAATFSSSAKRSHKDGAKRCGFSSRPLFAPCIVTRPGCPRQEIASDKPHRYLTANAKLPSKTRLRMPSKLDPLSLAFPTSPYLDGTRYRRLSRRTRSGALRSE